MRSRSVWSLSGGSLLGVAVGLATGAAAALLVTPMRGSDMRANLRARADEARDRGLSLIEEGRRALRTRMGGSDPADAAALSGISATPDAPLSATLGEIAQMHSGDDVASLGARS
jgi:hypothetical protein